MFELAREINLLKARVEALEIRVEYLMNQIGDFNEEVSPMEVKQCPVKK